MTHPISISISIAEIENGVIVSTDQSEGYGLSSPLGRGTFYDSLDAALSAMDDTVHAAWERARDQQDRYAEELRQAPKSIYVETGASQRYYADGGKSPDKLPEEAAVNAEPIPVVDEGERDSAFLRTDPVMSVGQAETFDVDSEAPQAER